MLYLSLFYVLKENLSGGFAITSIPKCHQEMDSDYCKNLKLTLRLQMVINTDSNYKKNIWFMKNGLHIAVGEQIPWFLSDQNRSSELIPKEWFQDIGLSAFLSDRHEMIFLSKKSKKLFWYSLSDPNWRTKAIDFIYVNIHIEFYAILEKKRQIYLVGWDTARDTHFIYKYDLHAGRTNTRTITQLVNKL